MIHIKKLTLLFILLIIFQLEAQNNSKVDPYNYVVEEVFGDLNKDGRQDKILITQDTGNEKAPYKLQIFFNDSEGFKKAFVSTTTFIPPKYPNGKEDYRVFSSLGTVQIEQGILKITFEMIRGTYTYKFRFQNGNFELIGYTEVGLAAGGIYTNDFNLSTGIRNRKTESVDTNKILSREKEKLVIRPLPKIQDIIAYENDDYLR